MNKTHPHVIRKLFLTEAVNEKSISKIIYGLHSINEFDSMTGNTNPDPIKLYIDSPGGFIYKGFSLINHFKQSKAPIHGIVTGMACSMAFVILTQCDLRMAYKDTELMYHLLSYRRIGNLRDHISTTKRFESLMKRMNSLVKAKTKIDDSLLQKMGSNGDDWFLTPAQAKKLGVIDKII
jgi:ATP-dependent Clp protease protease subunit